MRDLMLKLLTYEPFEKIEGDEKDYIDAVLYKSSVSNPKYKIYNELMDAFKTYIISDGKNRNNLSAWVKNYFIKQKNGKITMLSSANNKHTYYPVIFKKICFYCLTEFEKRDYIFMKALGCRVNILNKWHISSRYRRLLNRDTYHTLKLYRNGVKRNYLVKIIKAAYYEASRQEDEFFQYLNPDLNSNTWIAPKKGKLLPFCDCFAGTGTVSASVNANTIYANDIDVGAVTFMYSMAHDVEEVCKRLALLHNNFVFIDFDKNQSYYSSAQWQVHKQQYSRYQINDPRYDNFMIRIRNNYAYINDWYKKAVTGYVLNMNNPSKKEIETFYDIGIAWYFLHSFDPKNPGRGLGISGIDDDSYFKYLQDNLGVKLQSNVSKYQAVCKNITVSDIKFKDGIEYMEALKNATILNKNFTDILNSFDNCFIYLDPPYFLTTDYNVPFQDEEHKDMLNILRDAKFKWVFSLQYKEGCEDGFGGGFYKPMKNYQKRKKYQNSGNPIIQNYRIYYEGFLTPFIESKDSKGCPCYVTDSSKISDTDNRLFAILFDNNNNITKEMMICNFNASRVIPFCEDVLIIPFTKFLEFIFINDKHSDYKDVCCMARDYRENNIIKNYSSGDWL